MIGKSAAKETRPRFLWKRRGAARAKQPLRTVWQQHWMIYVMMIPALLSLILFHYYPMWGISIAFFKYNPVKGLAGSRFVGLGNLERFFVGQRAFRIIRNTLVIAVGKMALGQLCSIAFALLLNQVRIARFKKTVQSLTTLPHFLSWVIIGGVMGQLLSRDGLLHRVMGTVGLPYMNWLGNKNLFPLTLILSQTWKEFGWGAVIYLAALTAINPELHEAAAVDGAGRWARVLHIDIPGISPIIVLSACLSLGGILSAGFDQILVLRNPMVSETGEVFGTYLYSVGLLRGDMGLATAVGLLQSVVGFFLIALSWRLADRFAGYRVF